MQLVKKVIKENIPLREAIEHLGLKLTTARFIINKYKKNGTFPRRKLKRAKRRDNLSVRKINMHEDPIENSENKEIENDSANQQNLEITYPFFHQYW